MTTLQTARFFISQFLKGACVGLASLFLFGSGIVSIVATLLASFFIVTTDNMVFKILSRSIN